VILRLFVDSTGRLLPESSRVADPSGYPRSIRRPDGRAQAALRSGRRHGLAIATAFLQPVEFRHPQASGAVSKGSRTPPRPTESVRAPMTPPPAPAPVRPVRRDSTPARQDTFPAYWITTRAVPDSAVKRIRMPSHAEPYGNILETIG